MPWFDKLAAKLEGPQIVNDAKTPSGRAHVGALKGVLLHDAIFRALREKEGADAATSRYIFGSDDMDAADEIPATADPEEYAQYLGKPLCKVPPPPGSDATDMADHFIGEFFSLFERLGVKAETYRARELYASGRLDEPIDTLLSKAGDIREIYKKVSGADRPADWLPFQVVCENCGRIGTTYCFDYDGKEVGYRCRPDLVSWATGCGHEGRMSPFGGNGKMPFKVEWVAKWHALGITVEGCGEDHSTKGGSRDVADAIYRKVYAKQPPLNVRYGFILVGGAKMSSSKGIGVSAKEMVDFLPPELLRYIMIRPEPRSQTNFEPSLEQMVKLFNEYDRAQAKVFSGQAKSAQDEAFFKMLQTDNEAADLYQPDFALTVALQQLPHIDLDTRFAEDKGSSLTDAEREHAHRRAHCARVWLDTFASPEERLELQDTLPASAGDLDGAQKHFLRVLARILREEVGDEWTAERLQAGVFDAARFTPIKQPLAFKAFYRAFFDKDAGPKAGNILSYLDRDMVLNRLDEITQPDSEMIDATALDAEDLAAWFEKHREKLVRLRTFRRDAGPGVLSEFVAYTNDDRRHVARTRSTDAAAALRESAQDSGLDVETDTDASACPAFTPA